MDGSLSPWPSSKGTSRLKDPFFSRSGWGAGGGSLLGLLSVPLTLRAQGCLKEVGDSGSVSCHWFWWVSLAPPKTWRLHKTMGSGWELLGYCSRILRGESQGRMNSEGEGQVMLSAVSRDLTPPLHSHTQRTLQTAGDDSRILPSPARPWPENMGYSDPWLCLEKVSIFWAAHRTHSPAQPQAPTLWPFPDH